MTICRPHTRADRASTRRPAGGVTTLAVIASAVAAMSACDAAPSGSGPDTTPTSVAASASGEPLEAEQLAPGLLDAEVLGIPSDWAVRDVDASIADDRRLLADTDPFLGLLRCADGTIREGSNRVWLARKYTAPEVPLEDGLLSIEIIVEAESAADWEDDREAVGDCTTSEQAEVAVSSSVLVAPGATASSDADDRGTDLEAVTLELHASPTADVPYPSAFNTTTLHVDGRTITVVLGGVDMGQPWQKLADEISLLAVDRLHSPSPPG